MKIKVDSKRLNRKKIVVMVSPWRFADSCFNRIKKEIPSKYGYIHFWYEKDLLNSDPELTRKNFLKLIDKIIHKLENLNEKKKREYYGYGQSLGGLFIMISGDMVEFKKSVLILPGSNLADCFWNGKATKHIKKEMEGKRITLQELKRVWEDISPDHYFNHKAKKTNYLILLSKRDKVIPYKNGLNLLKLLRKKKINFKVEKSVLPHLPAAIRACLLPKKRLKFLFEN